MNPEEVETQKHPMVKGQQTAILDFRNYFHE